ncbi:glucose-1-phosphate adenylyltransferase [Bifidobacterium mongoliense]|uniref:glucose-1-phosphate adenylyltransferase n=1 Tax=Bifidobacterium mongoliense TaxID=518643 RepID=UPI0030F38841
MAKKTPKILSIVLAGGEGTRLMPLTRDRAKPAVPFGGVFRLVDFPLSNLVNSGYSKIVVLTQYKSHSLDRHISRVWRFSPLMNQYVSPVPAQQRLGKHWYLGSADAIYQTVNIIEDERPDIVVIVGADHVYHMDFGQMVQQHIDSGAEFTVAGIRQPLSQSDQFGVVDVDPEHPDMIRTFKEKPKTTDGLPGSTDQILASMGNYVANTDALFAALAIDGKSDNTKHDMGGDIAPYFAARHEAGVYDFNSNEVPGSTPTDHAYWRDVGTIKQFYDAHMDLIAYTPEFNLYNQEWPIYTMSGNLPPAKFVHAGRDRLGHATDSIVSNGVIVSGGEVHHSVLSPNVRIHSWAQVVDSVLFDNVVVNRRARVYKAILDKNVVLTENSTVGIDTEHDLARGFTVTPDGITVVPKSTIVDD